MQIHYQDISGAVGSLLKVKRTGLRRKVSCRGETRLLRLVKRDGGKVLKMLQTISMLGMDQIK